MYFPRPFVVIAFAGLALFASGCAVITKDRKQMVVVRSAPTGATGSINGKQVGVTPFKVRLARDDVYRIDLEKDGFAKQAALVLPSTDEYDQRFVRWGLDYQLGLAADLEPAELIVMLKPATGDYVSADPYVEMTAQLTQADSMLAAGQVSAADHKLIVAQIVDFYSSEKLSKKSE